MTRMTLAEMPLVALAVTEINLGGRAVPETYSFFGSSAGLKIVGWTPELGKTRRGKRRRRSSTALSAPSWSRSSRPTVRRRGSKRSGRRSARAR
jgi:hypothetical protein